MTHRNDEEGEDKGGRERSRPSGRKERKQMGLKEDAESICKKRPKRGKAQKLSGSSPLFPGFLSLSFSSGRGRRQTSQWNSMVFVLGRLRIEAVKPQPLTVACSIFTFCRIEIKQMTLGWRFHEDFIQHTHTASTRWLNI
jgi:hypothetical protein